MNHDFHRLINSTSNARMRIRYLAVSHFLEGKSRTEIAQFLKVSRTSVNKWVKAYLDFGLEGLQEKAHPGRPHCLTPAQLNQLKRFVIDNAIKKRGRRLQVQDIAIYIEQHFGIQYKQSNIYRILHDIGLGGINTHSKHSKQSQKT
jgi:transposase